MFVAVRAMAPVAGMPPKRGLARFAIPWAMSSMSESCFVPVSPRITSYNVCYTKLLRHELPDEDCISSLVSMALILLKFRKNVTIYIKESVPDQLAYLMNICSYNGIPVIRDPEWAPERPDVICILDTPKPDMVEMGDAIRRLAESGRYPVIEFDHHLSADATWCGSEGLRLVDRVTSTCELLAIFTLKVCRRDDVMKTHGITEMFSRNLVLSMLTGIIGDTGFGLTLKRGRDVFFYNFLTNRFAQVLRKSFRRNNFV